MCHCHTQPSMCVHKAPTAAYLTRNASIWSRSSGSICKLRNSVLQQRTKVRNSAQICRVEPGPVSALQRLMLFEFCMRDVRVCRTGLPLMSLCYRGIHGSGPHLALPARRILSRRFVAPSRTVTPPCRLASFALGQLAHAHNLNDCN